MPTLERQDLAEQVRQLIAERKFLELRRTLQKLEPPNLGELIAELGPENEAVAFRLLPQQLAIRTFEYLPLEVQEGLLKALGDRHVAAILDDM